MCDRRAVLVTCLATDGDMRAVADTLSAIRQRHVERELGRGRCPSGRSTKFGEARPVMPRTTMGADEMTPKRSGGSGQPDQCGLRHAVCRGRMRCQVPAAGCGGRPQDGPGYLSLAWWP
jgi:hypothetical protein